MDKIALSLGALALLIAAPAATQQPPPIGAAPVKLADTPYVFDTAEQHAIKVSVLAKGMARPFAIEFLPNGDLLVSERGGGLRVIHSAAPPSAVDTAATMSLAGNCMSGRVVNVPGIAS